MCDMWSHAFTVFRNAPLAGFKWLVEMLHKIHNFVHCDLKCWLMSEKWIKITFKLNVFSVVLCIFVTFSVPWNWPAPPPPPPPRLIHYVLTFGIKRYKILCFMKRFYWSLESSQERALWNTENVWDSMSYVTSWCLKQFGWSAFVLQYLRHVSSALFDIYMFIIAACLICPLQVPVLLVLRLCGCPVTVLRILLLWDAAVLNCGHVENHVGSACFVVIITVRHHVILVCTHFKINIIDPC